jgi:hypothetical protein
MGQSAAVRALSEEVLSALAEAKETPAKAIATASDEAAILRAGFTSESFYNDPKKGPELKIRGKEVAGKSRKGTGVHGVRERKKGLDKWTVIAVHSE